MVGYVDYITGFEHVIIPQQSDVKCHLPIENGDRAYRA